VNISTTVKCLYNEHCLLQHIYRSDNRETAPLTLAAFKITATIPLLCLLCT